MNIVREDLENQTTVLKVTVDEADYSEAVDKALRQHKRKANVPGFRPGMVPMGVINKMYRKGTLAEETYRIASKSAFDHIEAEKIEIVGDLLPGDGQQELDFDTAGPFEYVFELGRAPEVNIELTNKDKVKRYTIKIDDQMRERYRSNFLKRFGKLVDVDTVESDEALNVTLDQEEMKIEEAYVSLIGMSEEERKPFIGKKTGDKMDVDVNELYTNPAQRAAILHVKEDELKDINPKFTLEITKIRKFAEPEIDEEFFKMAFPDGNIKTKEEFEQHLDTQIALELSRETDFLFNLDLRDFLIKKANLTMPEEFLKRWLFIINEGKFPIEEIENDFPKFLDMMRWNLIQKHYLKEFGLEVTPMDMVDEAKNTARAQFAYYGMGQVADEMLENYADSILRDKDERRKIREKLSEAKVIGAVTPLIGVTEKAVSVEEFQKLAAKE